jgi:YggT family protein
VLSISPTRRTKPEKTKKMPNNFASALVFVVSSLAQLYLFVLLIRLLLPWLGADFRNPLAQGVLKITSPLVVPLRRVIPPIGRIDTATLLVTFAILYATIFLILSIQQIPANFAQIAVSALVYLPLLTLRLYTFLIIVRVVLSWVSAGGYNPAVAIIYTLTDPVLRPIRRIIPVMGGFDLSPIFAVILVGALVRVVSGYVPLPVL